MSKYIPSIDELVRHHGMSPADVAQLLGVKRDHPEILQVELMLHNLLGTPCPVVEDEEEAK